MAEQWELIERNPFKRVKALRVDQKQPLFLAQKEIQAIAEQIRPHARPFLFLALYTGMRLGEVTNLQWADIDWDRRVIHVVNRGTHHTKSRKERQIPIHDRLYQLLQVIPKCGLKVWPYTDGALSRNFKEAVRKAGLSEEISFHTLRHTFASYLVELGQPIRQVQELLGHSNVTVTEIYAHLQNDSLRKAVAVLEFAD